MQLATVMLDQIVVQIELPPAESDVIPGLKWGHVEAFPSPAYWAYQVYAARALGKKANYKLGGSLLEETGACLLGGHGIPAAVGLSAYQHLKSKGAFSGAKISESALYEWLSEPIPNGEKTVRYRFAKQKAKYLASAIDKIVSELAPVSSGKELRDWLLPIAGVGYKTASWIARNWLEADDVAILDIHILRAGLLGGFFDKSLSIERDYLKLEEQFVAFSNALGVRASELDATIWYEMMESNVTVHRLLESGDESALSPVKIAMKPRKRNANIKQMSLLH